MQPGAARGEGSQGTARARLEELLLPGTPPEVRELYLTLAERAEKTDFGLLEEDIVVLDTETTGLSFKDCELIEVSAARLSGREVVDRFETFIDPGRPIPPEISRLTGIRDVDVADAPDAEEAIARLADFVGGMPVIAHNATFDRTFVTKVRGGREVTDTWVDSLALSRIALPRLSSHRLSDMAAAFGCESVTHRAADDVDALCGMWRIILLGLTDLPSGLLAELAEMHPEHEWSFRPILAHLAQEAGRSPFSLVAHRRSLAGTAESRPRKDADELDTVSAPSHEEVREAFAPGGIVGRMYDSYECRPEQLTMALEVTDAVATSTHRSIEAGTGVGKSIAYLLPELLFAKRNDVTVGVATKTNALTDQLVSHELPALDRAMPGGLTFTSLKGYDHYPCLHRVERARREELPPAATRGEGRPDGPAAEDMLTAIAVCYAYASQSPDGDIDALGIRWRSVPRSMLTTTPDECLRQRCPFFPNECFVHGARRRASESDVVVTNHALLLRNVEAEGKILPPIRHWVVDEAHSLEAEARRQWAREVSGDETRTIFEQLGGMKSGVIHSVSSSVSVMEGTTTAVGLLTKAASAVSRASVACSGLFEAIHGLVEIAPAGGGYDGTTLWLDESARSTEEWGEVETAAASALESLDSAEKSLREAAEKVGESSPKLQADLQESARPLAALLDSIRLISRGEDRSYVYSAQLFRSKRRIGSEKLVAEKLDVGADLASRWLPETKSVVFTSATIAVGDDFSHFDHAVGLDREGVAPHKDVRLDSSFDYDAKMSVLVTPDMPAPTDRDYLTALIDLLYDVHVAMEGSVLTLFTNRRDMERVYEELQPRLSERGLDLICQERGMSPRTIRNRFLAEKSSSLLALKSFWEGFDASGETLRCVVIPKLPFASPNDPLVRERDARDSRAWWRYSLPEAVISVKQAAGRLIRTASDSGVLILADSRIATKRYGTSFTKSLPSKSVSDLDRGSVGSYIRLWRSGRGE